MMNIQLRYFLPHKHTAGQVGHKLLLTNLPTLNFFDPTQFHTNLTETSSDFGCFWGDLAENRLDWYNIYNKEIFKHNLLEVLYLQWYFRGNNIIAHNFGNNNA